MNKITIKKREWILNYIKKLSYNFKSIDTLNQDFSDKYIERFNVKYKAKNWGAFTCPDLAKQLRNLYNDGLLKRQSYGLSNLSQGFPKWIWIYYIGEIK